MPHILATIPNTTTMKKTIAKTTTNTSLSNGSKADAPNVIIVVQINAKTPNGANFKILLIISHQSTYLRGHRIE